MVYIAAKRRYHQTMERGATLAALFPYGGNDSWRMLVNDEERVRKHLRGGLKDGRGRPSS